MKNSHILKKATALFLLACVIASIGLYLVWRTQYGSTDFVAYYRAAERVVHGENPCVGSPPYIYPPFFACLLTPFTAVNIETAAFIWYMINLAFFIFSILICKALIFGDKSPGDIWNGIPLLPKILFLAVACGALIDNISLLQVNVMLLFLVASALYLFRKEMPLSGGMLLGAAISIKIIPVLFIPYFLIKKRFKIAASVIIWSGIFTIAVPLLFLGPGNTRQALKIWTDEVFINNAVSTPELKESKVMFNPVNQSIMAVGSRLLIKNNGDILHWKEDYGYPGFLMNHHASMTLKSAFTFLRIVVYALTAATFLFCLRRPGGKDIAALNGELSLIFLASLILDPLLRTPHFVFILFPAMFLLSQVGRQSGRDSLIYRGFVTAGILYLLLPVKAFRVVGIGTISVILLWLFTCHVLLARRNLRDVI